MSDALNALKPGQHITCTVAKVPGWSDGITTIERLMRRNPVVAKGLKKAHHKRQQTLNVYIRGNRDWTSRVKCGKIARVTPGATWTMPFDYTIKHDLASVAECLTIKHA
jgi:hypothetical protein